MKKETKSKILISAGLLFMFILWTLLVCVVDVGQIGPRCSKVGFSKMNGYVRDMIGTNLFLYELTDMLSIVPLTACIVFAAVGLYQWIKRKHFLKIDADILLLGIFYLTVVLFFAFFEFFAVNYRPILIEGKLEGSYPSSTTLLTLCVMSTSAIELNRRIKKRWFKFCVILLISLFTAFMVVGRIFSGVHWISDIIGGILLSAFLVYGYYSVFSTIIAKPLK